VRYLQHAELHTFKPVILQTNAELLDYVPDVQTIVISYNGGNKAAYEETTGMSHDCMTENVRRHYPQLARIPDLQLHVLICEFNADSEGDILTTWHDFPGRIRVSYKYDNQMRTDRTLPAYQRTERTFCDYLDGLSIWPDGTVISCAHDMTRQTVWGNVFESGVEGVLQHPDRLQKRQEHMAGQWTGLCERCNYNTPIGNRVTWLQ
jgi:radical SAM protein with 4Fe4S-binding SPASM domain